MLTQLIQILHDKNLIDTAQEVADILWLADQLDPPAAPAVAPLLVSTMAGETPAGGASGGGSGGDLPSVTPHRTRQTQAARRRADVYATQASAEDGATRAARAVRLPAAPALPAALAISRALRPLMRRTPSRTRFALDEPTTARRIADTDDWTPVLRPEPTRWLDVALVIDESSSMSMWQRTVVEFHRLLERQGAFRSVALWGLATGPDGTGIHLHTGLNVAVERTRSRDPRELLDHRGQRLILFVSDGVAAAWYNQTIPALLADWGRQGMVTLLQMLPEALWPRTALRTFPAVALRAQRAGAPNQELQPTWLFPRLGQAKPVGVALPVIPLEESAIAHWARLVAGDNRVRLRGLLLPDNLTAPKLTPITLKASEVATPLPADEALLRLFHNNASPAARRLAAYLATLSTLTLPLIHLIQRVLLPEAGQLELAEVLLSGLIRRVTARDRFEIPADQVEYAFRSEPVRTQLRHTVHTGATDDVRELVEKLSGYIEGRWGQLQDFQAYVVDQMGHYQVASGYQIMAQVRLESLRQTVSTLADDQAGIGGTGAGFSENEAESAETAAIEIDQAVALATFAELPLDQIPAPAALPEGSRMPFGVNPLFTGRADDLHALASTLKEGQTVVITGLGGTGKTQLTIDFAHRYGQYFLGGIYWLSMNEPAAIPSEVVACGAAMVEKPANYGQLGLEEQIAFVRSAWQSPLPRLLIFDCCEDPDVFTHWQPASGGCRVILTSRRAEWETDLNLRKLALGVLTRAESVELLGKYLAGKAATPNAPAFDESILDAIAAQLGDLPLALHLAGSFLARPDCEMSPQTYVEQLHRSELVERLVARLDKLHKGSYEHYVARTFALSYEQLDVSLPTDQLALDLLSRVASFASGEALPRWLLLATITHADQLEAATQLRQRSLPLTKQARAVAQAEATPQATGFTETQATLAIQRLVDLGLLEVQEDEAVRLYRLLADLVQWADAERCGQAQNIVEETVIAEANRLNAVGLPGPVLAWQVHLRYVRQQAVLRGDAHAAGLTSALGLHLQMVGDIHGATPLLEAALTINRSVWGERHPDTATSLNNLGLLHQTIGNLADARQYLEQALPIYQAVYAANHPAIAATLNNLGLLAQALGDLRSARAYFEQALTINRQIFGEAHISTADTISNLGSLLQRMGDFAAARSYFEQALTIQRAALGENHPDIGTTLNNLGTLLQQMGDYDQARQYLEQALAIHQATLGEQHAITAVTLNNLGTLSHSLGQLEAARDYLEQALAIQATSFGVQHETTIRTRDSLDSVVEELARPQKSGTAEAPKTDENNTSTINTGSGAYIGGNVRAGGDLVGRDSIAVGKNISQTYIEQDAPATTKAGVLRSLRKVLADLYTDPDESKRVLQEAGLNPAFIKWGGSPITNWFNILSEAERSNRLDSLLQAVYDDYGADDLKFQQTYQAYRATTGQPPLDSVSA